jgi:formylglycine-generating enzyme required for sulfatase activity
MVRLAGGPFVMGTNSDIGYAEDGEGPEREVTLAPFWIDTTPVTKRQFADFVKATDYQTEAEQFGWSFVFHNQIFAHKAQAAVDGLEWWRRIDGATWRTPEGPGSKLKGRMDHPVNHVTWNDAAAYAAWAGKRLPTEAEFEYASRGGSLGTIFPWGDDLNPDGAYLANTFQGDFPKKDSARDGFAGTCPVTAFPPNGYGIYSTVGNVWEWCLDWWSPDFHLTGPRNNPFGPSTGESKVMKGGSYLCHSSYCNRYRLAARTKNTPDSSTHNLGFRCVRDIED